MHVRRLCISWLVVDVVVVLLCARCVRGALGGMAYWLAFYPADTVKSAMQVQTSGPHAKQGFWGIFHDIYRTGGVYRGGGCGGVPTRHSASFVFVRFARPAGDFRKHANY